MKRRRRRNDQNFIASEERGKILKNGLSHATIRRIAVVGIAGFLKEYPTTLFRMPSIGPVFIR